MYIKCYRGACGHSGTRQLRGAARMLGQRACLLFGLLGAIVWSTAGAQSANTISDDKNASGDQLQEVVVTGTHIAMRVGFDSPTPVSTVTAEDFEHRGANNIASLLNEMPSFQASTTPASTGLQSATNGENILNLRGLGSYRTLNLVNGRRSVATSADGASLDINSLPAIAIDRVEVVTGGASAAYGSDAVAGVVNIIYKTDLTGVQTSFQAGESGHQDDRDYRAGIAVGDKFAGDNGHFLLAAEFNNNTGIGSQADRSWGAQQWARVPNPAYTGPGSGQPAQIIVSNATVTIANAGGVILAPGAVAGQQFGPGGTLQPFQPGIPEGGIDQIGGSGGDLSRYVTLSVPYERRNLLSSFSYKLSDDTKFTYEASYGRTHSENPSVPSFDFGDIVVHSDNPYIPAALQTQLAANAIPAFVMGRINTDMPLIIADTTTNTFRNVADLSGKLFKGWTWDVYYEYGETDYTNLQLNNRITANFQQATDAVINPANGQTVCRSSLTVANGCVPINLFGTGSPSAAAIAYITGTESFTRQITQQVASASAQGDLFQLPAGPVAAAIGGEFRREESKSQADSIGANSGFLLVNLQPIQGSLDVKEAFAEVEVPLLAHVPFAESLGLNGAIRHTDYSTSGTVNTWKGGLTWAPVGGLRFRGTVSRDIRAPNISELFSPVGLEFQAPNDPCNAANQAANPTVASNCRAQGIPANFNAGNGSLIPVMVGGNPNLKPEQALTRTIGVVVSPEAIPLKMSVDWFDIDITNAIAALSFQTALDTCYDTPNLASSSCGTIQRGADGRLVGLNAENLNIAATRTDGVDWEIDYRVPLSSLLPSSSATLGLRMVGTYTASFVQETNGQGTSRYQLVGAYDPTIAGLPKWRWNTTADYVQGPVDLFAQVRFISSGTADTSFSAEDRQGLGVPSVAYLDLGATYVIKTQEHGSVSIYAGMNNALDKSPPIIPNTGPLAFATNPILYDVVGRFIYVGVRTKF
jgi:iron complex outermembrane receptor protein